MFLVCFLLTNFVFSLSRSISISFVLFSFVDHAGAVALAGGGEEREIRGGPDESGIVARKRRWEGLNLVLDVNKKSRSVSGQMSLGYSFANWEQVKDFFPVVSGTLELASGDGLPQPLLDALHVYLSFATICLGSLTTGHEAKRVLFIAPVIIIVCSYFNGAVEILTEEEIDGNRIHAHGHFEFVLKRESKRICIVEVKKDDILQGKTQSLLGCESLCDLEDLEVAYGISTNYLEWCFLKNEPDKITEEMLTISLGEGGRPTAESLRLIANKIIAILQ